MKHSQKLHCRQIVSEKKWELDYHNIDSEDDELTQELFNTILKWTDFDSKILSITRIN
jgi:hypothetical protein